MTQKVVVWLTGLPGSGKSTIAQQLKPLLSPCVLLDGDDVRQWLTKDLGFSREDRRENVRRVTKAANSQLAQRSNTVVALISPYEEDRLEALSRIRSTGRRAILVHLDCPLEVCEQRDPKGMYARARSGEIPHFTGVDDPYESPEAPDVYLRTDLMTVEEAVAEILGAVGC